MIGRETYMVGLFRFMLGRMTDMIGSSRYIVGNIFDDKTHSNRKLSVPKPKKEETNVSSFDLYSDCILTDNLLNF